MTGIGHNGGPALEPGAGWRRHCWARARRDLLPRLPIEVVRNRVRRAAEIGLDYTTYATVRATTGRDIVAVLFSTNALRLFRQHQRLERDRAARLAAMLGCGRTALAVAPLAPADVALAQDGAAVLDAVRPAPPAFAAWSAMRAAIDGARAPGQPADGVLLVGDAAFERDWSMAGRLAGFLPSDRFFVAAGAP